MSRKRVYKLRSRSGGNHESTSRIPHGKQNPLHCYRDCPGDPRLICHVEDWFLEASSNVCSLIRSGLGLLSTTKMPPGALLAAALAVRGVACRTSPIRHLQASRAPWRPARGIQHPHVPGPPENPSACHRCGRLEWVPGVSPGIRVCRDDGALLEKSLLVQLLLRP